MKERPLMMLKVKFVDFSADFSDANNFFLKLLRPHYDIIISDDPDILFYSNFGYEHLRYHCKKVFYSGENIRPNFFYCDYSFSFNATDERNYFLPHFVEYDYFFDMLDERTVEAQQALKRHPKTEFCNFIASNAKAKERLHFVQALMRHKNVDCMGRVLFNMGKNFYIGKKHSDGSFKDWREEKLEQIKSYRFTIAFENEKAENYVTEKIFQPLCVGSIPIYWGAPNIASLFNPKCFINVDDFNTYEEAIDYILRVDQDESLYATFFAQPPLQHNDLTKSLKKEALLRRLDEIIQNKSTPVSQRYAWWHRFIYYYRNPKYRLKLWLYHLKQKVLHG